MPTTLLLVPPDFQTFRHLCIAYLGKQATDLHWMRSVHFLSRFMYLILCDYTSFKKLWYWKLVKYLHRGREQAPGTCSVGSMFQK
jgi:hypothetical protein